MINWFNARHNIIKFIICIVLLFVILLFAKIIFINQYNGIFSYDNNSYKKREIIDESDNYNIHVLYPKFNNLNINNIISDYVFNYIKDFKEDVEEKNRESNILAMNYKLSFIDEYLNIFFSINNSLNENDKYKNILINLNDYKISKITELYNKDVLQNKINYSITNKYPSSISEKIINNDLNDFIYDINEDLITIYFNNIKFNDSIDYEPYITISLIEDVYYEEYSININEKMVALTFDDGPSEYTFDMIDVLKLNNSKATFFMIGNRMKYNQGIVKGVYASGNEIGSHSYSHKNLVNITQDELEEEINSVTILYNEITGENLKYLRPPYGSIDSRLTEMAPYPLILWSIDTNDWLSRNPEKIAKHIIDKVYDGAIIVMHDIYPESVEAAKIVIPELKALGYQLVTLSDLAKYKNVILKAGEIIRDIK